MPEPKVLLDCIFFRVYDMRDPSTKTQVDRYWAQWRDTAARIRTRYDNVEERTWRAAHITERR